MKARPGCFTHHSGYFVKSETISQTVSRGASIKIETDAVNGPVYVGGGRLVGGVGSEDIVALQRVVMAAVDLVQRRLLPGGPSVFMRSHGRHGLPWTHFSSSELVKLTLDPLKGYQGSTLPVRPILRERNAVSKKERQARRMPRLVDAERPGRQHMSSC